MSKAKKTTKHDNKKGQRFHKECNEFSFLLGVKLVFSEAFSGELKDQFHWRAIAEK